MSNTTLICLLSISIIIFSVQGEPNIVLIITDDQDLLLNGLTPMKNTIKLLANNGKTFQNAFVNTPICCPSRSTILTGKLAHNLGVVNNSLSGNCSSPFWQKNYEPDTVAAILKRQKKYVTFYAGKYLNEYGAHKAGGLEHIPNGYDWWIGLQGNSIYYNYTLSINGTSSFSADKYLTDVLTEHSINFLENKPQDNPFFMTVATPAPHAPFTPAKRHENKFSGVTAVRTPSFNYSGSDKHWLLRMPPPYLPDDVSRLDKIQQHRLESLLAVDELIDKIVTKLKFLDILDKTYLIFMSDNGFHIGQFSQPWDKRQPYETDIRIPLIISGPKVPRKSLETFPVSAVDLAPTILDLVDIPVPEHMDGISFKKQLFQNKVYSFKKNIYIEYWGEGKLKTIDDRCTSINDPNLTECTLDQWCKCQDSKNNTYNCILDLSNDQAFKFCEFFEKQNFYEAYNLTKDPNELKNLAITMNLNSFQKYINQIRLFQECQGISCRNI